MDGFGSLEENQKNGFWFLLFSGGEGPGRCTMDLKSQRVIISFVGKRSLLNPVARVVYL